jgi:AbrB family looped-hinge helix DNA binding protein
MKSAATRLTSKGQVVIPKLVRDRLKWRSGLRLLVETANDGAVVLRPQISDRLTLIDELSGCLTEGDALSALEAEHRIEVEQDERRQRRRR